MFNNFYFLNRIINKNKSVIKNSFWLFLEKLIRVVFGLLVGAWVARYLGPLEFGELAYTLALVNLLQAIAIMGLEGIVVRDIAVDKSKAAEILGTAVAVRFICGASIWLVAILITAYLDGFDSRSTILMALIGTSLLFQSADVIDLWFQSQSQNKRGVFSRITAHIVTNGFKITLIILKFELIMFAWLIACESLIIAMLLIYAYKKYPCKYTIFATINMAKKLVNEGWIYMASGISIIIYMRIDQLIIKKYLGTYELGVYAATIQLATAWQFFPIAISGVLAPYLASLKINSEEEYRSSIRKIFSAFSLMGWIISIFVCLTSSIIVELLYGAKYESGINVIRIYAFTNLFICLGVAQGLWIMNERKALMGLYKTIIGATICIVGNIILIPMYGLIGVAIVAVLSQAGSAILSNIIFSKKILYLQLKSIIAPYRFL
jgi:PST family polysaccharide transporter